MQKLYKVKFEVEHLIEAYSDEQIKDQLSLAIGKMLTDTFGISAFTPKIGIRYIEETEWPD